jgi:hypothetical protein
METLKLVEMGTVSELTKGGSGHNFEGSQPHQ